MNRQTLIELLFDVQLENITATEAADLIDGDKALHDADVIADFVRAYERNKYEAIKHGGRLSGVAEFGRDYFIKLRNSVKEGDEVDARALINFLRLSPDKDIIDAVNKSFKIYPRGDDK